MAAFVLKPAEYTTGLVRPRRPGEAEQVEASRQAPVTQEIVNSINASGDPRIKIMDELGIQVSEDGKTEKSNNVPRMFMLQPSIDMLGGDVVRDLGDTDIPFGSLEFWQEVQKGNVFAYPAGQTKPVQLRLDTSVPGKPVFGYSKPIDPEDMPLREAPVPDPTPTKPWRLTMWFHEKMGLFSGRVNAYNQRVADYENYMARRNAVVNPVTEHVNSRTANNRLASEKNTAQDTISSAKSAADPTIATNKGKNYIKDIYGLNPVQHREFTKENLPENEQGRAKYTQAEFNKLSKINLNLDKIKIGDTDESLTEDDFVAVSMLAATQYKHLKKSIANNPAEADWFTDDMIKFGVKEPEKRRAESVNAMVSVDFAQRIDGPRENIGLFFGDVSEPARQEAKEAIENYHRAASEEDPQERKELKSQLGQLIAFGVNGAANYFKAKNTVSHQDRLMAYEAGRLLQLANKDPELKAIAEENGLDNEKIKSLKGMLEYDKIAREKDLSMQKLKNAAAYGTGITEQQKKDCVKNIIKGKTFEAMFKNSYHKNETTGKFAEEDAKLQEKAILGPSTTEWSTLPKLEGDQIYYGLPLMKVQEALMIELAPEPESVVLMSDPRGQEWLENFANAQAEKMDLDDLSAREIDRKLETEFSEKNLIDLASASMMDFAAPRNGIHKNINNPEKIKNIVNEPEKQDQLLI